MRVKLFTAFSGYDSQCLAMERASIPYDLVGWSEIDRNAIIAHDALFPGATNYGDIKSINWNSVPDFNFFTYSSPCQDFSRAGNMKGGEEGSGTRSSLLWEVKKAIEIKRPKVCVLENVSDLVSKRFMPMFQDWLNVLIDLGYSNYWKVINAIDMGIPQNRRRVYLVSILNGKDFSFPEDEICKSLDSFINPQCTNWQNAFSSECVLGLDDDETLRIRQATKEGWIGLKPGGIYDSSFPKSQTRRGRVQRGGQICPTLTASAGNSILYYGGVANGKPLVRTLDAREKLRLMGMTDRDVDLLYKSGLTESAMSKLAGNSIVIDVLSQIFKKIIQTI